MTTEDADSRAGMPDSRREDSGRNPQRSWMGASNVAARRESSHPETEQLGSGRMWLAAEGQYGQERRGPPVEQKTPRLLDDVPQGAAP